MILKGISSLAMGLILLWVSWNNWKHRDGQAIAWIEGKILALADDEPLQNTKFDQISRRIQAGLGLVFGLLFSLIGLVLIFNLGA